jgi:hypothetical protein
MLSINAQLLTAFRQAVESLAPYSAHIYNEPPQISKYCQQRSNEFSSSFNNRTVVISQSKRVEKLTIDVDEGALLTDHLLRALLRVVPRITQIAIHRAILYSQHMACLRLAMHLRTIELVDCAMVCDAENGAFIQQPINTVSIHQVRLIRCSSEDWRAMQNALLLIRTMRHLIIIDPRVTSPSKLTPSIDAESLAQRVNRTLQCDPQERIATRRIVQQQQQRQDQDFNSSNVKSLLLRFGNSIGLSISGINESSDFTFDELKS